MTSTFSFTKLVVHDVEKMAAFYAAVYGLHAVSRVRGESVGQEEIDEIMLSPDPKAPFGTLVLLKYLARGPSPSGELILGFTTDDLPALLERVTKAGGTVAAPIKELPLRTSPMPLPIRFRFQRTVFTLFSTKFPKRISRMAASLCPKWIPDEQELEFRNGDI